MRTSLLVLGGVAAIKLAVAARWGVLADEAYHHVWSLSPALGYFDQPPLVAWWLWLERAIGAPMRSGSVLLWVAAMGALARHARDRVVWWLWAAGLPPLAVLTNLAVPDALLLACWALALDGALRRDWVAAGVFGGLASLSKYTGALLLPLLWLAADREERGRAGAAVAIALAMLAPNLAWNAAHEWVTLGFVLGEGLATHPRPGLGGVFVQVRDQIGVVTPLAWGVGVAAVVGGARSEDRVDRLLATSAWPLWVLFAAAALGGRPEAHWPAPAWIGAGLLAARTGGRWARWGAGSAAGLLLAGLLYVEGPWDPAPRLREGAALAEGLGALSLPAGGAGIGVAPPHPDPLPRCGGEGEFAAPELACDASVPPPPDLRRGGEGEIAAPELGCDASVPPPPDLRPGGDVTANPRRTFPPLPPQGGEGWGEGGPGGDGPAADGAGVSGTGSGWGRGGVGIEGWAERYQEASLLTWHRGARWRVLPGCGRRSQDDLDPAPVPPALWFVRPATSGPPACLQARCSDVSPPVAVPEPGGRGWQLFRAAGCR